MPSCTVNSSVPRSAYIPQLKLLVLSAVAPIWATVAYANGRMVVLRVPYPMGFYAKGFDGRIDDPKAGWKGRGLWAANGDRTPWLIEGGKGTRPLAAHFQLRPDPLAK